MQRRTLLALGAVSATVLAVGGGALALVRPGLREGRLTEAGREVFGAAAGALLHGSLPNEPLARGKAIAALLIRIDDLIAMLPPHAQAELSQLLALLSTTAGRVAFGGLDAPWSDATASQLQATLQSMRTSSVSLRQQAYQALHDIVGGAYFSEAGTWSVLGYPGPLAI